LDTELRGAVMAQINGMEDGFPDNTVEVFLPMVRFFFPGVSLLWMRLPDEMSSFDAGIALAELGKKLGRSIAVLASADLTHYGPNYDFAPKGTGPEALNWVREVNDCRFIEAVELGNPREVLERAKTDRSSCSAGAVLGAMGFARESQIGPARLLEYGTSVDAEKASPKTSFVTYAAFAFGMPSGYSLFRPC